MTSKKKKKKLQESDRLQHQHIYETVDVSHLY